ncbi:hypothetical protein [Phycicoccus endophyticus]|uniref:hypothetical protein n=1 Tax=Phycicoccus endophyticus TaxID=1690220 RepID=UPI0016651288|nr:hypothetical protein [Phycicoccus endophyticus]GGL33189.1 hypothetical protein GCM10012283_14570 [Phycicoccus endophyticus]
MSDQNPPPPGPETPSDGTAPAGGSAGSTPPPPPAAEGTGAAAPPPPPPPAANPYGAPPPAPAYAAGAPTGPVTRPPAIERAVLLMRIGAALSVVSLLSVFFMGDQLRDAARQSLEDSGQTADPALLDTTVAVATAFSVLLGLLGAGLWLFMAWANGRGKSWARIVATVLFGFSVLSFLASLVQPTGGVSRILSVIQVALGGYIIYLLWRRESSQFYAASSAPTL